MSQCYWRDNNRPKAAVQHLLLINQKRTVCSTTATEPRETVSPGFAARAPFAMQLQQNKRHCVARFTAHATVCRVTATNQRKRFPPVLLHAHRLQGNRCGQRHCVADHIAHTTVCNVAATAPETVSQAEPLHPYSVCRATATMRLKQFQSHQLHPYTICSATATNTGASGASVCCTRTPLQATAAHDETISPCRTATHAPFTAQPQPNVDASDAPTCCTRTVCSTNATVIAQSVARHAVTAPLTQRAIPLAANTLRIPAAPLVVENDRVQCSPCNARHKSAGAARVQCPQVFETTAASIAVFPSVLFAEIPAMQRRSLPSANEIRGRSVAIAMHTDA